MTTIIHAAVFHPVGRDDRTPGEIWQLPNNLYEEIMGMPVALRHRLPTSAEPASNELNIIDLENVKDLLKTVRSNIVQSIRAFRVPDLAQAASSLGQHFLYTNCADAHTKAEVLETVTSAFILPRQYAKNFETLGHGLTDVIHKAGTQPGFVIVLEGLPCTLKFDKEARETLLDVFRDAADFWADKKIPFRVFYAFV